MLKWPLYVKCTTYVHVVAKLHFVASADTTLIYEDICQNKLFQSCIYSPTDANNIEIYVKTAPKCFGAVTPSSGNALIRAY